MFPPTQDDLKAFESAMAMISLAGVGMLAMIFIGYLCDKLK